VGHQVPGGMMDPKAYLPDGRTNLQQTIEVIIQIMMGKLFNNDQNRVRKQSNYAVFKQADFNNPDYYPLNQTVDLNWYRPIGPWMGRLILPKQEERSTVRGVFFEVHHADTGYEDLVGKVVILRWVDEPKIKNQVRAVTRDVHFSADATYSSQYGGLIHPTRLNHWQQVDPLESLAGSHPVDDMIVMLESKVIVEAGENTFLYIRSTPVEITGRYYSLVQFLRPIAGTDQFQVVHFNPVSRQFDGLQETVRMLSVIADLNGCFPSTTNKIEASPLNEIGWYIYGAKDASGAFVVQSYCPRSLLQLKPNRVVFGKNPAYKYIRQESWADLVAQKGRISSVLCTSVKNGSYNAIQDAIDQWQEGDRALVLHTYGGIGGKKKEPAAASPIYFGHFAYGLAKVIKEELADELRFEIQYYQVYTHNSNGLIAGTLHWSCYMGDRQFGFLGTRPVCDILVKLDAFTVSFEANGKESSALGFMLRHLQVMTARYRIGDGTGGTYVGAANNCSQDSNQALFASIRSMEKEVKANAFSVQQWLFENPEQAPRFKKLVDLGESLKHELQPFGAPRPDWENNEFNLGSTLEDKPVQNLLIGLGSWRTILPRLASDTVVRIFLKYGSSVWVLRTNQIGGNDPDIEPIAPMTI